MKRSQLEHLIRAAGSLAEVDDIIVVGSQAILGAVSSPPPELVQSIEADLFPMEHPERSELIDGAIGESSLFHDTHGYYAQGVSPETAILPAGWQGRMHDISGPQTRGVTGHCLDPHDLALSKYAAGRAKDRDFNRVMIRHGYVNKKKLLALLKKMDLQQDQRQRIAGFINADFIAAS